MTTYVTVAIPYVNAAPHLGYSYELVEADIYARALRRCGDSVRFLGGTDDHSLKNVLAAEAAGRPTAEFVTANARRFEQLAGPLGLSFDDFIHTSTDPRHRPAVERLWRACAANSDLYRKEYEGRYCTGCEQFYDRGDAVDGRCPEHGNVLEQVAEENWFFRLSAYEERLERLIADDVLEIRPEPFRQEVLAFVRRGLRDISVSRSVQRARGWGIGVPDDPTQVIYVWFDALTNYLSALEFGDPDSAALRRWWFESERRVHVVGKGILRFHAVYWPAFLLSAGLPLPTRIQVHPYLTVDGVKLSKSSGTTVDPLAVIDAFGTDALRWWFARDVGAVGDTDYTAARLIERSNDDLANGVGNVVHRVATLVQRARSAGVEVATHEPHVQEHDIEEIVTARLQEFDLRGATAALLDAVATLNRNLEATAPWRLSPDRHASELSGLLGRQLATATAIASAATSIVPALADRLGEHLGGDNPAGPPFLRLATP